MRRAYDTPPAAYSAMEVSVTMKKNIKAYAIGIIIPVAVGLAAAFLTRNNMDIYQNIQKPPLAPPAILFPIVWTILYILMGISSVRIYNSAADSTEKTRALFIYGLQLAVNFFWSIWFFNLQAYLLSFVWLVILWLLLLAMIVRFYRIDPPAAWLQLPYLLWVTFAGYLSFMIYWLNR